MCIAIITRAIAFRLITAKKVSLRFTRCGHTHVFSRSSTYQEHSQESQPAAQRFLCWALCPEPTDN